MVSKILTILSRYKFIFVALLVAVLFAITVILAVVVIQKLIQQHKEANADENKLTLRNSDFNEVESSEKGNVLRKLITPDAINPAPNGYVVLVDSGREIYERSFTISAMPKKVKFNHTFSGLLDFPSCTSSVFVNPISDKEMSRKLDRQINSLESEYILADGNTNRQRKLLGQFKETNTWADQVESGEEKFFDVGFLFTISARNMEALNTLSDDFRNEAISKGIEISSCYGVQSEAFLSNLPFNKCLGTSSNVITSDAIPTHQMDKKSVSTIFNYTSDSYSHRDGIPLGRNLFTKKPFVFDIYDPGHDGFLIVVSGKTGSGKSATIKAMVERYTPLGYRFVCVDSQKRKGTSEGEYAALTEIKDGANFQISGNSNNVLNIFEVHESMTFIHEGIDSGHEVRALDLGEKIILATNDVRTMMQGTTFKDDSLNVYIDRVITDVITELYHDFGIYDHQPDSLYEIGQTVVNGQLTGGLVLKKYPTMTDFYKKLLVSYKNNKDADLDKAYKLVLMGTKDYVRELYYSENSYHFFTREEYMELPDSALRKNGKVYLNPEEDDYEEVIEVHGVRPYFDGQSTISISKTCPVTDIDISQLTETERNVAREIAINFVNEQFIKVNSESINSADKLVAIFDEAHECFNFPYARNTLSNAARTARKMNVGLIFSTQTIQEFDRYDETKDILRQAAVKMVCKQDYQDKQHLMNVLHLTDSQAELICNHIGCPDDADEETKNKHRGEMCIIDTNKVVFIKVDILKKVESFSIESNAAKIRELYKVS